MHQKHKTHQKHKYQIEEMNLQKRLSSDDRFLSVGLVMMDGERNFMAWRPHAGTKTMNQQVLLSKSKACFGAMVRAFDHRKKVQVDGSC